MRPRARRAWLAALLASSWYGCATSPGAEETASRLRRDAQGLADDATETAYVPVSAKSEQDAWGRIVRARTEAPLEESRVLAAAFAAAHREAVEVVVGGPFPKLTEQVLLDALALAPRSRLPGLRVVIVSPEAPSPELRERLRASTAAWVHTPWSDRELQ